MQIIERINKAKENCSGCQACANSCPKDAITMGRDSEGFSYPVIDADRCVRCGACDRACPVLHLAADAGEEPEAWAFMHGDDRIRQESSSGGIFSVLAQMVLDKGGIVFGAAFDENWQVAHIGVEDETGLARLRSSKYVQSDIGKTYRQAREALNNGRSVLFSGTPCQIEGLHRFLGKSYPNLWLVDLICHGAPSPLVWEKYVQLRQQKGKILGISFRSKNLSWERFLLEIVYANSSKYQMPLDKDLYMQGFLQDLYLRPSCYACQFKKKHRVSDITIADFWGIDQVLPEMNDHKGTSLVILHSQKAKQFMSEVDKGTKLTVSFAEGIRWNPAMICSVKMNSKRDGFFRDLWKEEIALDVLLRKYTIPSWYKTLYKITRILAGKIKRKIMIK